MNKKAFLILLLLFGFQRAMAYDREADSLLHALQLSKPDTNRIKILKTLGAKARLSSDSTRQFVQEEEISIQVDAANNAKEICFVKLITK